jgi:hypothetical protein
MLVPPLGLVRTTVTIRTYVLPAFESRRVKWNFNSRNEERRKQKMMVQGKEYYLCSLLSLHPLPSLFMVS